MASNAIRVLGTEIRVSVDQVAPNMIEAPAIFESLNCLSREIVYEGGTSDEIGIDTFCSTDKEQRLGLSDGGTLTVSGFWNQKNLAHKFIRTAAADKKSRLIEVVFEDGTTFRAIAFVSQRSWSAGVSGVVGATYSFRITGGTYEKSETTPVDPPVALASLDFSSASNSMYLPLRY